MLPIGQITQEEAEALLDRGRLAWLLGECKRITGAVEVCVSRKQWARNAGPAVCKVRLRSLLVLVRRESSPLGWKPFSLHRRMVVRGVTRDETVPG